MVSMPESAMKTYSLNEVLDDIKRTIGIDIEIDLSKTGARYPILYSQFAEMSLKYRLPNIEDEGVRKRIMGSILTFLECGLVDTVFDASETLRQLDLKFRSGNRTDIDRVFITKREWEAIKDEFRVALVTPIKDSPLCPRIDDES